MNAGHLCGAGYQMGKINMNGQMKGRNRILLKKYPVMTYLFKTGGCYTILKIM